MSLQLKKRKKTKTASLDKSRSLVFYFFTRSIFDRLTSLSYRKRQHARARAREREREKSELNLPVRIFKLHASMNERILSSQEIALRRTHMNVEGEEEEEDSFDN